MPRFHFNIFDGVDVSDAEGTELANWHDARIEAIRRAGLIFGDTAHRRAIGEDWHMEVTDERGLVLFRLDFVFIEGPVLSSRHPDAPEADP